MLGGVQTGEDYPLPAALYGKSTNPGDTAVVLDNWSRDLANASAKAIIVSSHPHLSNGASLDAMRGNTEGTLLASAARTAETVSANQTNHNGRVVTIYLNIAAVGTGSLTLSLDAVEAAGNTTSLGSQANISVIGTHVVRVADYAFRQFRGRVVHSDASSWTYSLTYAIGV
jgi:hypothetical protein